MRGTVVVVNRALNKPLLIAGVEKRLAVANALICFPLIAATHLHFPAVLVGIGIYCVLHVILIRLSKIDPEMGLLFKRNTRYFFKGFFPATSHVHYTEIQKVNTL